MKNLYDGYVINKQGASQGLPRTTSIRSMETFARSNFGSGWTVCINKVLIDGDGTSYMGTEEVKKFTIR